MIHIVDIEASQTNPRKICSKCWSIITRDKETLHDPHQENVCTRSQFSQGWGDKTKTTSEKLILLAGKENNIIKENNKVVSVKLLSYNYVDPTSSKDLKSNTIEGFLFHVYYI